MKLFIVDVAFVLTRAAPRHWQTVQKRSFREYLERLPSRIRFAIVSMFPKRVKIELYLVSKG